MFHSNTVNVFHSYMVTVRFIPDSYKDIWACILLVHPR